MPFDRDKLMRSIQIALRKRPVDPERIERVVNGIVRRLESSGESEIPSTTDRRAGDGGAEGPRRRRLCALRLGLQAISARPRTSRMLGELGHRRRRALRPQGRQSRRPCRRLARAPTSPDERSDDDPWRSAAARPARARRPGQPLGRLRDRAATARSCRRGWTAAGRPPARRSHALEQAGEAARGATIYVTLEPCAHPGQDTALRRALIAAGAGPRRDRAATIPTRVGGPRATSGSQPPASR